MRGEMPSVEEWQLADRSYTVEQKIIRSLENIAREAKSCDTATLERDVKELRAILKQVSSSPLLSQLDQELDIWEKKISVIANEPAGRQGMAKHAHHWTEIIKKAG